MACHLREVVFDMIHSLQKMWIPIWSGLLESQASPNLNFYFFPFFLLLPYRGFFHEVILLSNQVNAASKISLASYLSSYKKKCNYLLNVDTKFFSKFDMFFNFINLIGNLVLCIFNVNFLVL